MEYDRNKIIEIMEAEDLNVRQLALRCGIPYSTLRHIVRGDTERIGLETIRKICVAFDMTLSEFFGGT